MKTKPLRATIYPLLFLLSGCSGNSDLARTGNIFYQAITGSHTKVARDQVAAIPYATMGLELGSSPQTLLILGTISKNELDWYASDQLFVATQRGRVIRTAGLPFDMGSLRLAPAMPIDPAISANPSSLLRFSLDFPDLGVFEAPAECSRRNAGDDAVDILGASIPTRRIVEHCTVPALKWSFDNQFWEDRASGFVWRSSQYVHPKSPPIVLEVLRPEQGDSQ